MTKSTALEILANTSHEIHRLTHVRVPRLDEDGVQTTAPDGCGGQVPRVLFVPALASVRTAANVQALCAIRANAFDAYASALVWGRP